MNEISETGGTYLTHSTRFTFQRHRDETSETRGGGRMTKDELHGFVVKLCTDEQLDAAINDTATATAVADATNH